MCYRIAVFSICLYLVSVECTARDCEAGAQNMSQVRACLYDQQSAAVDVAYKRLYATLKRRNPEAAKALEKSQASWEAFAGDSCEFYALLDTGSIPRDAQVNCWADFSRARTRILESWLAKLEAGQKSGNRH